jgi:hypothetical protein
MLRKNLINVAVLQKEFPSTPVQSDGESEDSRPSSPISPPSRRTFYVDADYEIFHAVLFWLYTHRASLTTSPEIAKKSDYPPVTMDAEGLYATASRLHLDSLAKKAFHFLQATTDVRNISSRVFGRFAAVYADVGKFYDEFFLRNWEQVKRTEDLEQYFDSLEENYEEHIRVNKKFRKMIKG